MFGRVKEVVIIVEIKANQVEIIYALDSPLEHKILRKLGNA